MQKHYTTYFGRPKAHITAMMQHIMKGRSRNARKIDTTTQTAQRILGNLNEQERKSIEEYMQRREDDHALAAMYLLLQWVIGEELPPNVTRKELDVPWGEEITESWGKQR